MGLFRHSKVFSRNDHSDHRSCQSTIGLISSDHRRLVISLVRTMAISIRYLRNVTKGHLVSLSKSFRLYGVARAARRHIHCAKYAAAAKDGLTYDARLTFRVRSVNATRRSLHRHLRLVVFRIRVSPRAHPRQAYRRATTDHHPRRHGQDRISLSKANTQPFVSRSVSPMVFRHQVRVFLRGQARPISLISGGSVILLRQDRRSHRVTQFVRRQPKDRLRTSSRFVHCGIKWYDLSRSKESVRRRVIRHLLARPNHRRRGLRVLSRFNLSTRIVGQGQAGHVLVLPFTLQGPYVPCVGFVFRALVALANGSGGGCQILGLYRQGVKAGVRAYESHIHPSFVWKAPFVALRIPYLCIETESGCLGT